MVSDASVLTTALDAVQRGVHPLLHEFHIGILPRGDWMSLMQTIGFMMSIRWLVITIPFLRLECKTFYHDPPTWLRELSTKLSSNLHVSHVGLVPQKAPHLGQGLDLTLLVSPFLGFFFFVSVEKT
jgi:hypothetical protein